MLKMRVLRKAIGQNSRANYSGELVVVCPPLVFGTIGIDPRKAFAF